MSLTRAAARDAILKVVNDAWTAPGAATASLPLHFDDVAADVPGEDGSTQRTGAWGRATFRTAVSPQQTIGEGRRWRTTGTLTINLFTPPGDGNTLSDSIAQVVLDALRGYQHSASSLVFYDIVAVELGLDRGMTQANVNATVSFQEVVS